MGEFSWDVAYPRTNGKCAWHPNEIQGMMRQQYYEGSRYNELVIDTGPYAEALPASLAGFFIQPGSETKDYGCGKAGSCRDMVSAHHSAFLAEFSKTAAEAPLLMYDPSAPEAFSCVRC